MKKIKTCLPIRSRVRNLKYLGSFIILLACFSLNAIDKKEPNHIYENLHASQALSTSLVKLHSHFVSPPSDYRPETWFHLNGKNISEDGLTADLEALNYAGIQGIHLFNKSGPAYPNVEQVAILSPKWEQMIGHIADETERLNLTLTMQNCPGWSMAGGPWVPAEEAQREVIYHTFGFNGGKKVHATLDLDAKYLGAARNYQDIKVIAFPTPLDETSVALIPQKYESNNPVVPWSSIIEQSKRVQYDDKVKQTKEPYKSYQRQKIANVAMQATWLKVTFARAETLRSIEIPPIRSVITNRLIPKVDIRIVVDAVNENGEFTEVATLEVPSSNWYDRDYPVTFSLPETTAKSFRFTFLDDPLFLSYMNLNGQERLHNYQAKASKAARSLQSDISQIVSPNNIIDSKNIIDISASLNENGQLNWLAPKGNWTVVRIGHVNMLKTNRPAEPEATGWETSKLDKVAIENHLRNGMMGNLMRPGGPLDGHKLHGMLIDSWESHVPTWTIEKQGLITAFQKRRGYDMTPYLAATMGYIVDSVETSNKFLRDLRQTMDDLYVENFFAHFRTVSHDMGAKVYTEGASGEVLPGDPLRYYGVSDFPMTEFWYPKAPSNKKEAKPILAAASATHLYNKPFLAAEAATQLNSQWNESPADIQTLINQNFAKGVNHLVFHTFSHTPQMNVVPGSTFGGHIGFPLLRTQTWWRHTPSWIDALSRSQYMLRQGEFGADVLWYLGDDLERNPFDTHPFPEGYKFDFLNEEILQTKVNMKDGQINVKGAGNYRVIMLKDSQRMLLSTARKLQALVKQGAVILGNKPKNSPSLMDSEKDLSALKTISDKLWGTSVSGVKSVGKGRVYWGLPLQSVLEKEKIQADVSHNKDVEIAWLHRRADTADIYFVANPSEQAIDVSVGFRQGSGSPEIWDPITGQRIQAKVWHRKNNVTNVALQLPAHSSQFVVFDKASQKTGVHHVTLGQELVLSSAPNWFRTKQATQPFIQPGDTGWQAIRSGLYQFRSQNQDRNASFELEAEVKQRVHTKPWKLRFQQGWDTPKSVTLKHLKPLNEMSQPAMQHYSGSVIYTTDFDYDEHDTDSNQMLDLGDVYNIAEVWINNIKVGTRWIAPYRFDVSGLVKQGRNTLKVVVTNTWRNQLIFDNQRPVSKKKTWTTNPPKKHQTVLDNSGLVGPVTIVTTNIKSPG